MRYTLLLPPQVSPGNDVFLVSEWRREIGEMVGEGEPLVVLRTGRADGAEVVFPSPVFGVLTRKIAPTGAAIETGEPLAVLSGVPDSLLRAGQTIPGVFSARPPYVPGGPEEIVPLSPREQAVAAHQAQSLRATPHVSTIIRVDVTETVRLAAHLGADHATDTVFPFVLCAAATALQKFPALNAERAGEDTVRRKRYVHIGFPVHDNRTGALIAVPVVRDADKKSVRALSAEIGELTQAAHAQTLPFDAQRGATFTLTRAVPGVLYQTPIIALPQAAALCVGTVSRLPTVVRDKESERIEIRSLLHLCLSHDARLVSDITAGEFLADMRVHLEETHFLFAG